MLKAARMARVGVQRSSSGPLALVYAALVLYASLYPFTGWRWPPGVSLGALLVLPWPPWRDAFDVALNMLGYVPLGALLYVRLARAGHSWWRSGLGALALSALLSYAMEVMQQFVPMRVPSRVDWALNCAGAAVGAALMALLHWLGLLARWQALRERWFVSDSAGALALLALWPLGLLFPTPVPLGLGHVGGQAREWLVELFDDVPWAQPWHEMLQGAGLADQPLPPLSEGLVQMFGLLAPCLLAISVTCGVWHRAWMALGVLLLAGSVTTLSTALSFGPGHALAWLTPTSAPAWALGMVLAGLATLLSARSVAGIGLVVLTALVVLVSQSPADPYFAVSLQNWEQGRFVRFNGLALWIGWLWPYAAMAWLLMHLRAADAN
jgi:VanZ family protein